MRKLYWLYLLVTILGLARLPAAHATALEFQPPSQVFNAGDTVSVGIAVTGLGSAIVAAYDLDVPYDATALTATNVVFDANLGATPGIDVLENFNLLPSVVDLAAVSLLSDANLATLQAPLSGTVPLATLVFTALASSDTSSLSFAPGSEVKGANNQVIVNGLVNVPEPDTVLLFGIGLAASLILGRRKIETR